MSSLSMVGTFSKHPKSWGFEHDLRVIGGNGARLLLTDGREMLDWVSGLGSNLLGYNHPEFIRRVEDQLHRGAGYSLPSFLEDLVADKLVNLLAYKIEGWKSDNISVRFGKTGSDATSMAVRLARAVTGRDVILQAGYSGWSSDFIAATPPALGIPQCQKSTIHTFKFNDLDGLANVLDESVAAIIIEQGVEDPKPGFYDDLRTMCNEAGALLILDEIVTGLRFDMGGAANYFGIEPDLITMGKALANGMAVSALVGRKEYLDWFNQDSPVFASSTHWGEAVSLAAANAVLDIWNHKYVKHLWKIGGELLNGLNKAGWHTVGHPPRSLMLFDDEYERAFFIQGMRKNGILMNRPQFPSLAHTEADIGKTIGAAIALREELDSLEHDELDRRMKDYLPHILFKNR